MRKMLLFFFVINLSSTLFALNKDKEELRIGDDVTLKGEAGIIPPIIIRPPVKK